MVQNTKTATVVKKSRRITTSTESFVLNSILKHGFRYDYTKAIYKSAWSTIVIICRLPGHGEFEQTAVSHCITGQGCKKCFILSRTHTSKMFIEKAIEKHGDKYDYSKVQYINSTTRVIIICRVAGHGEFLQTPSNHLAMKGCKRCAGCESPSTSVYIEKARAIHGTLYCYSLTNYVNAKTDVKIICMKDGHGMFEQNPRNHLRGSACNACGIERSRLLLRNDTDYFIQKANIKHNFKYGYSNVSYVSADDTVTIFCPQHGEFLQRASSHLLGHGCSFCINKTEYKLYETLKYHYPTLCRQYKAEWCKNKRMLPFDFCIPENKILIELDGRQHFEQVANWQSCEETVRRDTFKTECANKNDYSIIRLLQEDVWRDTYDWCSKLCNGIEEITRSASVRNIYLCVNNEYMKYRAEIMEL